MSETKDKIFDTVVVGAGAAGLTAAIYTSRRTLNTLVVSKDIGGLTSTASEIENYPGYDIITGPELMMKFKKQAEKSGASFLTSEVTGLERKNDLIILKTNAEEIKTKSVIIAHGLVHRLLNVPGEKEFRGRGVSYCATCDASFYKDKTVAVVGGGNSALDAADLLSKIAKKIYLVHRRDKFKGEQVLIQKVNQAKNVEIIWQKKIIEIKGDQKVTAVTITDFPEPANSQDLQVDGLFIEIGYQAKTEWLKDIIKTNEQGEIKTTTDCETNVPGVFAAGDVTSIKYKQIVISAGDGAKAGLQAYRYLQSKEGFSETGDWGKKH